MPSNFDGNSCKVFTKKSVTGTITKQSFTKPQIILKNIYTSNRTPVCQSLPSIYYGIVSFRAKIRVIPNVSYERELICAIKYICYEYSLTNNKTHLNCLENNKTPLYLKTLLPKSTTPSYNLRISKSFIFPNPRTDRFKASFFPFCATSWDQIDPNIHNAPSLMSFKHSLLQFIRPTPSPVYHVHHPRGLKLLTRLSLRFSHLREHKFRHNFHDTIKPFCLCTTNDIETNEHFLLHCPNYSTQRLILFDNLRDNGISFLPLNSYVKRETLPLLN